MPALKKVISNSFRNLPLPQEAEFRRQMRRATIGLVLAMALPLLLLVGLAAFLLDSTHWVDHSDQVLAQINQTEKLLTTLESKFQGYLLTKDPDSLKAYATLPAQIESNFKNLEKLVADKPSQEKLARQIHAQANDWINLTRNSLPRLSGPPSVQNELIYLQTSRRMIDSTLATGEIFISAENKLRQHRAEVVHNVVLALGAFFATLAVLGIPLISFRHRRSFRKMGGLYEASLKSAELRATELEVTLKSIGDAVIATDSKGCVEFLNPVAETLSGWTVEAAYGRPLTEVFQIFHEQTGAVVDNPVERVLRENIIVGLANHTVLRSRTGHELPIEDSAAPIRNDKGEVVGVILVFHDVSVKRANELKLAEEEWRARSALEIGGAGSWIWDIAEDSVTGDAMLSKTFGVPFTNSLKGPSIATFLEAVHEQDRPLLQAAIKQTMLTSVPLQCEYRVRDEAGRERWVHARGRLEKDAAGNPLKMVGFLIDISERKYAERALAESNERFRLLSEVVETQVWTATPAGELDYANQQCVAFFYADLEHEILGNAWTQFVHPDDLPAAVQRWQHSLATGERYEVEFRLRSHTGEYRWFLARAKSLRDAEGRISKWFGTNTDIDGLKNAQNEALSANRAKDDFLAALSHELRTPLNPALLIASEAADNGELPEPVRENFEEIRKSIELEARLIDDLLDLTRITSGKLALQRELVDAHAIFTDALAIVQAEQTDKKITLTIAWEAQENMVYGDAVRLQQVFWNVLKNAVKFTPKLGRITVKAFNSDPHSLIIQVTDTGIGLRPDELPRLFQTFVQGRHADGVGSHRFGGLGLGLAISKNLIALHSGKISAESPGSNQGATFTIELPLAGKMEVEPVDNPPAPAAIASAPVATNAAPLVVLLVEDHDITRTVLTQLLTRRNYQVLAAESLAAARAMARQHKIDLLVSDIGLPDGSGNELMAELRQKYGLKGIALSGYGMEEDIARGKTAGFVAHLIKPIRLDSLEQALAAVKTAQ